MPTTASSSNTTRSTEPTSTHEASSNHVTVSLNHPHLDSFDPSAIRIFLKNYDAYSRTVIARAKQVCFSQDSAAKSSEVVLPVDLKFCVDGQLLHSALALDFIAGASVYDELEDKALRAYLDKHAEESEKAVNLDILDQIIVRDLRMNM